MFSNTTATKKIFSLSKRIRAVAGGTSASKTISILMWCIDYCQSMQGQIVSVVSESYPHLEKGAMRDFEAIMKSCGYWEEGQWNKTKHAYSFETGSTLEFTSIDSYGKAHGPRRDVLFINEANNLAYNIVDQLMTRTRGIIWMDWNPSEEFWFYTDLLPHRSSDIDFLTLTYKDNEALDATTIADIESHKSNANWWKVYGLGQLGATEARIYSNWAVVDSIPHEARLERRGLDFGYSHDPAAVVAIYYYNGGYILDEELYQRGMFNKDIADFIKNLERPQTIVIADSVEPKSIDEIRSYGVTIRGAKKGADSKNYGIKQIQAKKLSVTARSTNLLKEYRTYLWVTDKDGLITSTPEDGNDHALDALRYGFDGLGETDRAFNQKLKLIQSQALTGDLYGFNPSL